MKVLKPGNGQTEWSIESTCTGSGNGGGGCGALLLVSKSDLYRTSSSCRDETTYFTTFKCPCCGVETDLPDGKVPYQIQRTLRGKTSPREDSER